MLKTLSIRNVVLIDSLDIDFSGGLTVLSGETGAGKSILLDSLGLLLGSRSESSLVRTGADKLSVTGVFEVCPDNKIYDIAVSEAFRGQKIGQRLNDAVKARAKADNIANIELEVFCFNSGAMAFYHKLGYTEVSQIMSLKV